MMKKMLFLISLLGSSYLQLAGSNDGHGVFAVLIFGMTCYGINRFVPQSNSSLFAKPCEQSESTNTSKLAMQQANQLDGNPLSLSKPTPTSITDSPSQFNLQAMAQTQVPFSKESSPILPVSPRSPVLSPSSLPSSVSSPTSSPVYKDRSPILKSPEPDYDLVNHDDCEMFEIETKW